MNTAFRYIPAVISNIQHNSRTKRALNFIYHVCYIYTCQQTVCLLSGHIIDNQTMHSADTDQVPYV